MKHLFLTCFLMIGISLVAQNNFEGVIVYHRKPGPSSTNQKQIQFNSGGVNGIEKVFFKGSRMKIEREFYSPDTVIVDVTYYDFKRFPNSSFSSYNGGDIEKKNFSTTQGAEVFEDKTQRKKVLGFNCHQLTVVQELGTSEKYVTDQIQYTLPEESRFNGFIVSHLHDFIPLKRIEKYTNPFIDRRYTIDIEAVLIFPMDLPDSIFEFEEGDF